MHEYEIDLADVNRIRTFIEIARDAIARMIRARDNDQEINDREINPGELKRLSYNAMKFLSRTYISGIAAEASRMEGVLAPEDLELAQEILIDIEDIVEKFAKEELDEEDEENSYYRYG